MLALIALVTLVLLARAFRSLVLAVKAVIFNLASLGVAYGVMVLVWQQGHGSQALWSIPATGSITVYVPLLPSLIGVLGRWNWWLPAPAARILRVPRQPQPPNPPRPAIKPPPPAQVPHRGASSDPDPGHGLNVRTPGPWIGGSGRVIEGGQLPHHLRHGAARAS